MLSVNIKVGFLKISYVWNRILLIAAHMVVEIVFSIFVNMENTMLQLGLIMSVVSHNHYPLLNAIN